MSILRLAGAAALLAATCAAAADERSARPPAVAYVVIDGLRIDAPLGGPGDPVRGRALFADPETGGCTACHAAPGLPHDAQLIPRVLRDRFPAAPPAPPAAAEDPPTPDAPRLVEATAAAPAAAPLPAVRPAADEDDAEAPDPDLAAEAPETPPLLPLPPGPDLSEVAARLAPGEIRLMLVNARLRDPQAAMPAYHNVSLPLARQAPALRQPWFDAQEIEDVVAYLLTLEGDAAGAEADDAPGDAPGAPPAEAPEAGAPDPEAPDPAPADPGAPDAEAPDAEAADADPGAEAPASGDDPDTAPETP